MSILTTLNLKLASHESNSKSHILAEFARLIFLPNDELSVQWLPWRDLVRFANIISFLLINCEVTDFVRNGRRTPYDVIFLDAERSYYSTYWPALQRLLMNQAGSVLVVDNVISHQEQVADFISLIESDSSMMKTVLPVGAGLLLVTKA